MIRFFNFFLDHMVQKYQNEIPPIFYYGISTKTSEKDLKIPNLQALTLGRIIKITLYNTHQCPQKTFRLSLNPEERRKCCGSEGWGAHAAWLAPDRARMTALLGASVRPISCTLLLPAACAAWTVAWRLRTQHVTPLLLCLYPVFTVYPHTADTLATLGDGTV